MCEKIDSRQGRATYAHRMGLIEPVFGHIQQRWPAPIHAAWSGQGRHAVEAVLHRPHRGQTAALWQDGRVGGRVPAKHVSCGRMAGQNPRVCDKPKANDSLRDG